jgi:hypothetical protein
MHELGRQIFWHSKSLHKRPKRCNSRILSEETNVLQKEKQALKEKADLLQEESHLLQKTIVIFSVYIRMARDKSAWHEQLLECVYGHPACHKYA